MKSPTIISGLQRRLFHECLDDKTIILLFIHFDFSDRHKSKPFAFHFFVNRKYARALNTVMISSYGF